MSKKNFISYGDGETLFSQIAYMFSHLITGHRIKDNSGNAMTARDVLKVDGYLETTDDSTNAQTVISDAPNDITWTQYLAKSASEKQGKKWLIHDVPGICAKINAEMLSLLWENPDPTASFAAQDIADLTTLKDYNLYIIAYHTSNTDVCVTTVSFDNMLVMANYTYPASTASYGAMTRARTAQVISSQNKVTFSDCNYGYTGIASTVGNGYLIPYQIYGLKTTLDGTMFMMAEDLGTSADKCMLSDGETSVETKIGEMEANFQAGVDDIYDAVVAKGSTPASHSLSDVVQGIEDIETGITPSGTYTYPSGSTGGTVDVTNYAKVNAANVYAKGKADAAITFTTQTKYVTGTQGAATSKTLTYTFPHKILGITNLRTNYSDGLNRYPEQFYTVTVTGTNTVKYTGSLQNQNGGTVGITCIGY